MNWAADDEFGDATVFGSWFGIVRAGSSVDRKECPLRISSLFFSVRRLGTSRRPRSTQQSPVARGPLLAILAAMVAVTWKNNGHIFERSRIPLPSQLLNDVRNVTEYKRKSNTWCPTYQVSLCFFFVGCVSCCAFKPVPVTFVPSDQTLFAKLCHTHP